MLLDPLENFPRPLPRGVQNRLRAMKKKGIFDDFMVLHLSYDKERLKTTKEKIVEKDPILFGFFKTNPTRLYFVADWVDEHCDLTLDKFVETVSTKDPNYEVGKIEDIDDAFIKKLKEEVEARNTRLSNTRLDTWKQQALDEERSDLGPIRRWLLRLITG